MRYIMGLLVFVFIGGLTPQTTIAADFSFSFMWGKIPECFSGTPNMVPNPIFTLKNVPKGAVVIKFRMKDLNALRYNHGGGKVRYTGGDRIGPGAFRYKSPCPPSGSHTYRWTAEVLDASGRGLAEATSEENYPR